MKIKQIFIGLCLLITGVSCNDWLEVSPENQVNEKELFAEGEGFRNALNGIYKEMATTALYGREMTYGFMEVVARTYNSGDLGRPYSNIYNYNYDDQYVKPVIASLWEKAYNAIANCNNLIEKTKKADTQVFIGGEAEKGLIEGEALALRAYLHFDMLRLFAPLKDDENTYIPYHDTYGALSQARLSVPEVLERVESDLILARQLVASFDTIGDHKKWLHVGYRLEGKGDVHYATDDLFYAYRGYRMNYYAITAALARVYSWSGKMKEAYDLAMEVIDAREGGNNFFPLLSYGNFPNKYKMYNELIFVLSNQKLVENYEVHLSSNPSSGSGFCVDNYLFGWYSEYSEPEDQRFLSFLEYQKADYKYYMLKYQKQKGSAVGDDMLPMIRISEMYYIAAEYLYKNGQETEAIKMVDKVRNMRGKISVSFGDRVYNESSFESQLALEVHKDLMGEGQAFFWYKRFNLEISYQKVKYVLPLPDSETIF